MRTPPKSVSANQRLIRGEDLERTFNAETVKSLAAIAKLPPNADLVQFGESVRTAVRRYLNARVQLSTGQLRDVMKRVFSLCLKDDCCADRHAHELARIVDQLPTGAKTYISANNPSNWTIPSAAEILNLDTRDRAIARFGQMVSCGARIVQGEKRKTGRHSRTIAPYLKAPVVRPGRPRALADRAFIECLALCYLGATGRLPPLTVHYSNLGPFGSFVDCCFKKVGAPTCNISDLINEYGSERRSGRP